MKQKILLLLLFACVLTVHAEEKPLITVLPFQGLDVSASVSQIISQLFETNLVNTHAYEVLSQNERDMILKAQESAISDCTDESCAIEIGKLLAAEQIIMGTVAALGKKYIINAKIIDVTTSRTLGADSISAQSVEELDIACKKLTLTLVGKAMPDIEIAEKPEEAETTTEAEAEKPEEEPAEEEKPEEEKPAEEKAVKAPGKFNPLAFAALSGGILFLELGNLTGSIGFESKQQAIDAWSKYISASENLDNLYSEYEDAHSKYSRLGISSYALWGLGASAVSASFFLFPSDSYNLSFGGKLAFASSLALTLAGNYLSMIACNQRIENDLLWQNYIGASANLNELYDTYESGYKAYSMYRILSYSMWSLGGLGMAGSFFIPGQKEPVAPSLLNKLLISGGMAMIAGGSFTHAMALNKRTSADEAWDRYISASANLNALYDNYESEYGQYSVLTFLSYGLWAGGGAAVLTSLFVPFKAAPVKKQKPVEMSLIPTVSGFNIQLAINPKGNNK